VSGATSPGNGLCLQNQPLRQMRRLERHGLAGKGHALLSRGGGIARGDHAFLHHAGKHMIAAVSRRLRMAVGTLAGGRLGQRHQQRALRQVEARRLLAEIGKRGGAHAFQVSAHRRQRQVEGEDFAFGIAFLKLQGADDLEELGGHVVAAEIIRLQQARDLHGQGGAAADDMPHRNQLQRRTQQRARIDAEMGIEALILISLEHGEIARANLIRRCVDAPGAVLRQKGAQQRAVTCRHFRRQGAGARHVWGIGAVGGDEGEERAQRNPAGQDQLLPRHFSIVICPIAVRAWMAGAYMSTASAAGSVKRPTDTARAI